MYRKERKIKIIIIIIIIIIHCGVESSRVTRVAAIIGLLDRGKQQGQLSGCGGVIRSLFGLLLSEGCGTI